MVQIFDSLRCYRASHVKYSNSPSRITTVGMFHKMEKNILALFDFIDHLFIFRERSDSIIDVLFQKHEPNMTFGKVVGLIFFLSHLTSDCSDVALDPP